MTDISKIEDFSSVSPTEFAQLVKGTPDSELQALLDGHLRQPILHSIFARMPESFRPDRAGTTEAVIHWIVSGGPAGAETYEVRIANGACETSQEPVAFLVDALHATPNRMFGHRDTRVPSLEL